MKLNKKGKIDETSVVYTSIILLIIIILLFSPYFKLLDLFSILEVEPTIPLYTSDQGNFYLQNGETMGFLDYASIQQIAGDGSVCQLRLFKDIGNDGISCCSELGPSCPTIDPNCNQGYNLVDVIYTRLISGTGGRTLCAGPLDYTVSSFPQTSGSLPAFNLSVRSDGLPLLNITTLTNDIFHTTAQKSRDFFEGLTNDINVRIYSKYDNRITAKLNAEVRVEAVNESTGGIGVRTINMDIPIVYIYPGTNEYNFTMPTYFPIGAYSFWITPMFNTPIGGSGVSDVPLAPTQRLNFLITPRPTWIIKTPGENCIDGYTQQIGTDGILSDTVCVREDLQTLPCVQLGCPITVEFTYQCGSDGLCSEQIYRALPCAELGGDIACGTGSVCIEEINVCVNEQLAGNINTCSLTTPCSTFCEGVTAVCDTSTSVGKCVYSGTCEPIIDCNANLGGCPGDYSCDTDGYCKRTTTITQTVSQTIYQNVTRTVLQNGTIVYVNQTKTTGIRFLDYLEEKGFTGTLMLIIVLMGIIIYFAVKESRKGKN